MEAGKLERDAGRCKRYCAIIPGQGAQDHDGMLAGQLEASGSTRADEFNYQKQCQGPGWLEDIREHPWFHRRERNLILPSMGYNPS